MKALLTGFAVAWAVATAMAQTPTLTLGELLFRANESVVAYEQVLSNAIVEEQYVQRIVSPGGEAKVERRLRSDMLLVQLPGATAWLGFRDVFEVDGEPVRDRDARLQELFLAETRPAFEQAITIARESAHYNIGRVVRTVNLPTVALAFLHTLNQHRFFFEHVGEAVLHGRPTWVIEYSEQARPTFVQMAGIDVFSRGRFWLDVDSGETLRSELILGSRHSDVRTTITVDCREDASLNLWVPEFMRELYERSRDQAADTIEARATYLNFGQFDVQTEESVSVPR